MQNSNNIQEVRGKGLYFYRATITSLSQLKYYLIMGQRHKRITHNQCNFINNLIVAERLHLLQQDLQYNTQKNMLFKCSDICVRNLRDKLNRWRGQSTTCPRIAQTLALYTDIYSRNYQPDVDREQLKRWCPFHKEFNTLTRRDEGR